MAIAGGNRFNFNGCIGGIGNGRFFEISLDKIDSPGIIIYYFSGEDGVGQIPLCHGRRYLHVGSLGASSGCGFLDMSPRPAHAPLWAI